MSPKKVGRIKFHPFVNMPNGRGLFENDELELSQIDLHKSDGTVILDQNVSTNCEGSQRSKLGM